MNPHSASGAGLSNQAGPDDQVLTPRPGWELIIAEGLLRTVRDQRLLVEAGAGCRDVNRGYCFYSYSPQSTPAQQGPLTAHQWRQSSKAPN